MIRRIYLASCLERVDEVRALVECGYAHGRKPVHAIGDRSCVTPMASLGHWYADADALVAELCT